MSPNLPHLVAGEWMPGEGTDLTVYDPSTEDELATLPTAGPGLVEGALAAARRAQPGWAAPPSIRRGDLLRAMADIVDAESDRLARGLVAEVGKPIGQARDEVAFASAFLRYNAGWDRLLAGEILAGDVPDESIHLLRAPVGVVAAICPWNFPLAVLCRKLAPALVTGNTVVIKPSEISPLTTIDLIRLWQARLDLPAGVVNLVIGGLEEGNALASSPLTSLVSFTGHRDTGKRVMAAASANLTGVSLELGGKAPAIVWRDADLDMAVPAITRARHTNAGQVCTAAERVLIHTDLVEEFTHRYLSAIDKLKVGAPGEDVDMGPMASRAQLAKAMSALTEAKNEGAVVLRGEDGLAGEGFDRGYWFAPTVLTGVRPDMQVMQQETFAPITPIIPFSSVDEAMSLANDSCYGLSAYLFSRDYDWVMRSVDELQFGEIYVNRTLGESVHAHHAGIKESGIGGADGKWGLLEYTHVKTVYHHYGPTAVGASPEQINSCEAEAD